jgi:mannose-6-phosphate isomerase-like protein (cupin superfamily)
MAVEHGDGWAVGHLEDMGSGWGFRKVRRELGVTAFGVNAIVVPPRYQTNRHVHERQQEVYFVHRGTLDFVLGDGEVRTLGPGGIVRVDAHIVRAVRNPTDEDAVYVCFGGESGYVGRDASLVEEGRFLEER